MIIQIAIAAALLALILIEARHLWINRPPVTYDPNTGYYRSARLLIKEQDGGYGPRRPIHHNPNRDRQ